ncbi:hypothetical protein DPMN_119998 [Dreissena polymorpha]|uniref:Secreted protein n=1 Tax=Dreissena polymorpha TaxID=45954 RepID=A0A9D4JN91_DREPO|nr:hypothetical protein DPMN_119998 [Dreissena polymorpha]
MLKRFVIVLCALHSCWCKSINHPGVASIAQPDQPNTESNEDKGKNIKMQTPDTTQPINNIRTADVDFIKAQAEAIRRAAAMNPHLYEHHRAEDKYKRQWNTETNGDL